MKTDNLLKNVTCIPFFFIIFFCIPLDCYSDISKKIHPRNKMLIQMGILKQVPKYYPNIPRVTIPEALGLYKLGKAVFFLISHRDRDKIVGGYHLTEGQVPNVDPNKFPVRKNQVLIFY